MVNQQKMIAITSLKQTNNLKELTLIIDQVKEKINTLLKQLELQNSVFYFPFADAKGELDHLKKCKEKQRDSAIILTLDPANLTRASYKLLYNKIDMMQAAIMSYDSLLIPICELKSENFNSAGTQIIQIGPDGVMNLENNQWIVSQKLSIKVI